MRIAARLALDNPRAAAGLGLAERATDRVAVALPTTLRTLGYHGHDVLVQDISTNGFMAESHADFPVGAHARLKLPGIGVLIARIVWAAGNRVGGEFVTPVDPVRLGRIVGLGPRPAVAAPLAALVPQPALRAAQG